MTGFEFSWVFGGEGFVGGGDLGLGKGVKGKGKGRRRGMGLAKMLIFLVSGD